MEKLLLTPVEAASMLGIGRTKLYELLKSELLASVLIDTSRRIPRAAVEEFIADLWTGSTIHRSEDDTASSREKVVVSAALSAG